MSSLDYKESGSVMYRCEVVEASYPTLLSKFENA